MGGEARRLCDQSPQPQYETAISNLGFRAVEEAVGLARTSGDLHKIERAVSMLKFQASGSEELQDLLMAFRGINAHSRAHLEICKRRNAELDKVLAQLARATGIESKELISVEDVSQTTAQNSPRPSEPPKSKRGGRRIECPRCKTPIPSPRKRAKKPLTQPGPALTCAEPSR